MKVIISLLLLLFAGSIAMAQSGGNAKPKDESEVPRISLADAKAAFDKNTAVFVDARSPDFYKLEHVKGAINIPLGNPNFDSLPKGKTIIVYCSWPNEHTSAGLAFMMINKGIPDVFALKGGTQAWKDAKYPMEKSD